MRFLKGCKTFFLLCMLCAAVSALADMVAPQIVRVTVDQVILGEGAGSLHPAVSRALEALGGAERLRERKIVERGTHRQLLDRKGHYYRLYTRQYEDEATNDLLS